MVDECESFHTAVSHCLLVQGFKIEIYLITYASYLDLSSSSSQVKEEYLSELVFQVSL